MTHFRSWQKFLFCVLIGPSHIVEWSHQIDIYPNDRTMTFADLNDKTGRSQKIPNMKLLSTQKAGVTQWADKNTPMNTPKGGNFPTCSIKCAPNLPKRKPIIQISPTYYVLCKIEKHSNGIALPTDRHLGTLKLNIMTPDQKFQVFVAIELQTLVVLSLGQPLKRWHTLSSSVFQILHTQKIQISRVVRETVCALII